MLEACSTSRFIRGHSFRSESHVDNSIEGPEAFMKTNVLGSFQVLDVARPQMVESAVRVPSAIFGKSILHVSTDEVFGSWDGGTFYGEDSYARTARTRRPRPAAI